MCGFEPVKQGQQGTFLFPVTIEETGTQGQCTLTQATQREQNLYNARSDSRACSWPPGRLSPATQLTCPGFWV